jgi:hypothetical protein
VSGVVSAWGKVIRCGYGFRAEYMKLEAFIVAAEWFEKWGTTIDLLPAHRSLAEKHGVPLIKPDEVSAFMGLSGGSVLECEDGPWHVTSTNVDIRSAYGYHGSSTTSPHDTNWAKYWDGITWPEETKGEVESTPQPSSLTAIGEAGLTPKWSKDQMKGGKSDAGD